MNTLEMKKPSALLSYEATCQNLGKASSFIFKVGEHMKFSNTWVLQMANEPAGTSTHVAHDDYSEDSQP
jgi:hypothetical protein